MLEQGTTLAGYRIDRVLGQGGMGTVYEATQLSLDRVVALKLLAAHLSNDMAFRARFRREGQVQARLEHPHVVTVYEAGETEHGLFIAMRLVRGRTLKEMINARELDVTRTLKVLGPVAEALDEAHGMGLIHRDIKPQNVLVGGRDHSFLADFGLTKGPTEASLTKTGHFVGTFDYISPEQINGQRATPASDVYSLAGVLYECLTGEVPFPRPAEAAVLYAHVADPPPRPTEHRPELPPALDGVIGRAMAKEPDARHPSASELIREVETTFAPATQPPHPIPVVEEGTRVSADLTEAGPTAPAPRPAAAPPAKPPAPPRPRETPARGLPVPLPLLGAGALALVVAAGFLLGKAGSGDDAEPEPGSDVSAGSLSLRAPAGWDSTKAPRVSGLALKADASIGPGDGGGSVTVGMSNATGPALLPTGLVRSLDVPPPTPEAVQLGELDALRYSGLEPEKPGEGTVRLYAAPTTKGVATVACVLPLGAPASLTAGCDESAASLELGNGKAFPLGRDKQYEATLRRTIKRLNAKTESGTQALRRAKTPNGQAQAARSLQAAYSDAADSLRNATKNPQVIGANRRIVAALENLARRYGHLAAAARADDASDYGTARYWINQGKKRLNGALDSVETA